MESSRQFWCLYHHLHDYIAYLHLAAQLAAMAQNEQTTEEHSTPEQQSPGRLDHPAWCVVWTV